MAEITTIASSTRSPRERIRANIERKFRVCPAIAITVKVTRKTRGTAAQATRASLTQIIKNNVINTRITVIIQSLIRCDKSSLILSD